MTTVARYQILFDREAPNLKTIRRLLTDTLKLHKGTDIFQKHGGKSDDLGQETMNYELYTTGFHDDRAGAVALYSVEDDNTNGYCQMISVVARLSDENPLKEQLLSFLEELELVSSYASFKDRTLHYEAFKSYLSEIPSSLITTFDFVH